jgi:D-alanyl-D-alanine carboxypeptidase
MKKMNIQKKIWALSFSGLVLSALLVGCGVTAPTTPTDQSNHTQYQSGLNDMIAAKWTAFGAGKANWVGGVSVYVTSPRGNYYASCHMPNGTKDSHFRGASTTKTFTASAIMLLHQQGKLNINDLITATIPGSSEPYVPNDANYAIPYKNQITIKLLLEHRAGVFDVTNSDISATGNVKIRYLNYVRSLDDNHTFTFDELVGVAAKNNLSYFLPDTDYHYSNTGFNILGKIIERVSGQRYDQFIRDNLVIPNSLSQTSFPYLGTDQIIPAPFEAGCVYSQGQFAEVTKDNMSGNVSEGNMITTPENLTRWLRLLVRGEAGVLPSTVALMKTTRVINATTDYGLGLFRVVGLGWGHTGAHNGYLTAAFYDPEQDVSVVVSASLIDIDMFGEMDCLYDISRSAKIILGYSAPSTN